MENHFLYLFILNIDIFGQAAVIVCIWFLKRKYGKINVIESIFIFYRQCIRGTGGYPFSPGFAEQNGRDPAQKWRMCVNEVKTRKKQ